MRISDWSSDVCSSDLQHDLRLRQAVARTREDLQRSGSRNHGSRLSAAPRPRGCAGDRSEEHTSELQSLMRISYAVFCLKKKKKLDRNDYIHQRARTSISKIHSNT